MSLPGQICLDIVRNFRGFPIGPVKGVGGVAEQNVERTDTIKHQQADYGNFLSGPTSGSKTNVVFGLLMGLLLLRSAVRIM